MTRAVSRDSTRPTTRRFEPRGPTVPAREGMVKSAAVLDIAVGYAPTLRKRSNRPPRRARQAAADVVPAEPRANLSRKGRLTRQRLIQATLDVISKDGMEGLTTGKIARLAGLTQPGFYLHFANMDEAMAAAAEELSARLLATVRRARRFSGPTDSADDILYSYGVAVRTYASDAARTEMFQRYRFDPTPFGRTLRGLEKRAVSETVEDLRAMGFSRERLPEIELFVELSAAMTIAVVNGIRDGRYPDPEIAINGLARAGVGMLVGMTPNSLRSQAWVKVWTRVLEEIWKELPARRSRK